MRHRSNKTRKTSQSLLYYSKFSKAHNFNTIVNYILQEYLCCHDPCLHSSILEQTAQCWRIF